MVNTNWIYRFPSSTVTHKLNIDSGHCPLVVCLESNRRKSKMLFRFESIWMEKEECRRGGMSKEFGTMSKMKWEEVEFMEDLVDVG